MGWFLRWLHWVTQPDTSPQQTSIKGSAAAQSAHDCFFFGALCAGAHSSFFGALWHFFL
jgi:hypothetical protein